ncbi:MAG: DNA repair protein RecN [Acutalibacteraceae bacterium]
MLSTLKIENVAVIEQCEIVFDKGLNILTGETGAGKSIVIDSINMILGERTSREIIRDGCDKAKVSAFFENVPESVLVKCRDLEIETEDNTLLITRVITSDSRSLCRVNGHTLTVSMLREIGRGLITICGQHDSQYLLSPEKHLSFVDAMADSSELLESYLEAYGELKKNKKELLKLLKNEDDKQAKLDYLSFQIDELTKADLKNGEKEELLTERKKLLNIEKYMQLLHSCGNLLNGDENTQGITSQLFSLVRFLSQVDDISSVLGEHYKKIEELSYILEECSREISSEISSCDGQTGDLNFVEERLDLITRLENKYQRDESGLIELLNELISEKEGLILGSERAAELEEIIAENEDELFKRGCYLSDCRKETGIALSEKVTNELQFLDMPHARFYVNFTDEKATLTGMDACEFLFSGNSGQDMKPLSKIASGGELSRVMLAIRCVLSDNDELSTMIFDEIDTGVSGRAAHKIAYKMREVSKGKQVICVTHLAQIAAYADTHLFVSKCTVDGNTYTKVKSLSYEERVNEIARIMGGELVSDSTLISAREMIEYAENS